jgi:hypothetical protein
MNVYSSFRFRRFAGKWSPTLRAYPPLALFGVLSCSHTPHWFSYGTNQAGGILGIFHSQDHNSRGSDDLVFAAGNLLSIPSLGPPWCLGLEEPQLSLITRHCLYDS